MNVERLSSFRRHPQTAQILNTSKIEPTPYYSFDLSPSGNAELASYTQLLHFSLHFYPPIAPIHSMIVVEGYRSSIDWADILLVNIDISTASSMKCISSDWWNLHLSHELVKRPFDVKFPEQYDGSWSHTEIR